MHLVSHYQKMNQLNWCGLSSFLLFNFEIFRDGKNGLGKRFFPLKRHFYEIK